MTKRTLKGRIDDLEAKGSTDAVDQIIVVWNDDERPELQPGDVRVWMDKNGEVQSEVIK